MDSEFQTAVEEFPWESKEQKEGYLALVQYGLKFGLKPSLPISHICAFFIQKDHESHIYWNELVGTQVRNLQDEIRSLQDANAALAKDVDLMKETLKSQNLILEKLLKTAQ